MKAIYKDTILADSDKTLFIEGNHYFPPESVKTDLFTDSDTPYICPWKGVCQYHNLQVGKSFIKDAAWSYPNPKEGSFERVAIINDGTDGDFTGYFAFDKSKDIDIIDR